MANPFAIRSLALLVGLAHAALHCYAISPAIPVAAAAAQPAAGFPLQMTAAQAHGGVLSADGTSVALSAAMDTKEEVRWDFPAPLEPGAWRVTVEFDGKPQTSTSQVIGSSLGAPRLLIASRSTRLVPDLLCW